MPSIPPETIEEIGRLHRRLTESREVLYKIADENLPHTSERLSVVSAATEAAATSLLDGLELAIGKVDRLEACGAGEGQDELVGELRNLLFDLIGHLQFQDIINQQLAYASSVLAEAESRLGAVARSFGVAAGVEEKGEEAFAEAAEAATFDPGATMLGQDERQALADALFTSGRVA